MKIKLSKSQWQFIGKTAGWLKKADQSQFKLDLISPRKGPEEVISLKHQIRTELIKLFNSIKGTEQEKIDTFEQMIDTHCSGLAKTFGMEYNRIGNTLQFQDA